LYNLLGYFCNLQKAPKVNNRPIGENSPKSGHPGDRADGHQTPDKINSGKNCGFFQCERHQLLAGNKIIARNRLLVTKLPPCALQFYAERRWQIEVGNVVANKNRLSSL
jgi:hypothetical protein